MDAQRWVTGVLRVIDAPADRAQGVYQVADRPLVHARRARDGVLPSRENECGGERSQRRSSIAEEKIGLLLRKWAGHAADGHAPASLGKRDTQTRERFAHYAGVVRVEEPPHLGLAGGERGEKEDAIGDAFRAGQAHRAAHRVRRLQVEDFSHWSRAVRASTKSFSSAAPSPAWSNFSNWPSLAP